MPTAWRPGDPVYARYFDPATQRYVIRGEGRVVAVEGETLVMRTRKGTERVHAGLVFRSREEGEAAIAQKPSPYEDSRPMAHYGADSSKPKAR